MRELGRDEDALGAAEKATDVYRRLAADRPDAVLPDFATSLNNLGAMLSALGQRDVALPKTQEAVEIRRRLAADRPDAFLPDLAVSLHNLSFRLAEFDRRDEAVVAARDAVAILTPFFIKVPFAFAHMMDALFDGYLDVSRYSGVEPDAALTVPIVETFQRLRTLASAQPQSKS